MADNLIGVDPSNNPFSLATKDIGGNHHPKHIQVDGNGNEVPFNTAQNPYGSLKVTFTDALTDTELRIARVDTAWLQRANGSQESFFSTDRVLMTANMQYAYDRGRTNAQSQNSWRRVSLASGPMASKDANDSSPAYQGDTSTTRLFRVMGFNSHTAAQYLLIWDRNSAPTRGTDAPTHIIRIPVGEFDKSLEGIVMQNGFYYTWQASRALNGALSTAGTIQDWNIIKG